MGLITQTSSLIGGVSQQVAHKRTPNQVSTMDNCWPSVVDGLTKRASLEHISVLSTVGPPGDVKLHAINRDVSERYLAVTQMEKVQVFDPETGAEFPVYADIAKTAADFSYLDTRTENTVDAPEDFTDPTSAGWTVDPVLNGVTVSLSANTGPLKYGRWTEATDSNEAGKKAELTHVAAVATSVSTLTRCTVSLYVQMSPGSSPLADTAFVTLYHSRLTLTDSAPFVWDGTRFVAPADFVGTGVNNNWAYTATAEDLGGGVQRLLIEGFTTDSGGFTLQGASVKMSRDAGTTDTPWTLRIWGAHLTAGNDRTDLAAGKIPPYLGGTIADSIRAASIADSTFFVNSLNRPALNLAPVAAGQPLNTNIWWVFVKEFLAKSDNGLVVRVPPASPLPELFYSGNANISSTAANVGTTAVANSLVASLNALTVSDPPASEALDTDFETDVAVCDNLGSLIRITPVTGLPTISILARDGLGGRALHAFQDEVEAFFDLPAVFYRDWKVQIVGEPGDVDNYWAIFETAETGAVWSAGIWKETVAPGRKINVNADTMPHVLTRHFDSETKDIFFTFAPHSWKDATVGDDFTDPWPFFTPGTLIGSPLTDVFLFKGRLGFLTEDRVILSDVKDLSNFWRTSVRDLSDSDRIVAVAAHKNVSNLTGAVALDEKLILFSDQNQFILRGDPILTPRTVEIVQATALENFQKVQPVSVGTSVFFGVPRGDFYTIQELFTSPDGISLASSDLGQHIPQFAEGPLIEIAGSSLSNTLFMLGKSGTSLLFYKWFDSGNQRVQGAWGRMTLDQEAVGLAFIQDYLYVLGLRNSSIVLSRMRIMESEEEATEVTRVRLDNQLRETQVTLSYDSATDRTTLDFPFTDPFTGKWWVISGSPLEELSYTYADNAGTPRLTLIGDQTASTLYIGRGFDMTFRPTLGLIKTADNRAMINATVFLSTATVFLKDASHFDVSIYPQHGQIWTSQFRGEAQGPLQLGLTPYTGIWRFGALLDPTRGYIEFQNSSPYNSAFQGIEWEYQGSSRGTRV